MNGFIKTTVAGLCLGTGITALVGCHQYRQLVDPCWPERYNAEARMSVRNTFGAQAHNGHVLDQTMWNYHFEVDPKTGVPTDRLNAAGTQHLQYLARRQPVPDPKLYLQTAQEIPDSAKLSPDKLGQARSDLDNKRIASIQRYLAGMMSGRGTAVAFEVAIHDPAEVGIPATPIGGSGSAGNPKVPGSINQLYGNFKGSLDSGAGGGSGGGGGASGGGGSSSSGSGSGSSSGGG